MDLGTLLLVLFCVGVVLYCINRWAPIDGNIKQIITWVAIGFVVIWLLKILGIFHALSQVNIGNLFN